MKPSLILSKISIQENFSLVIFTTRQPVNLLWQVFTVLTREYLIRSESDYIVTCYVCSNFSFVGTYCYWREQFFWNWYNNKVKRSTLSFCFYEKLMQIIRGGKAKTSSLTNSPSRPCTPRPTKTRNTPRSAQKSASKRSLI